MGEEQGARSSYMKVPSEIRMAGLGTIWQEIAIFFCPVSREYYILYIV